MIDQLIAPFADFAFMRRALAAGLIMAVAAAPVGVFLLVRRMSLTGEALSHGMLPGIAIAFLVAGTSTAALAFGATAAGLAVAALATLAARRGREREDAGFAAFFTIALALGVVLLSVGGASADLAHILFGSALGVDAAALVGIAAAASATLLLLACVWPALVLDAADPAFLASVSRAGPWAHAAFMAGVVLTLAAGFQAVGTLMSVGLLVLPAAAARLWTQRIEATILVAAAIGAGAVVAGLLGSYHWGAPSGPCIVLAAGAIYGASLIFSPKRAFAHGA
ncbi:MAG: metal ABC transporter permease [Alphaproteobacteria bacterium]|nr:metal ABC transporter permease [Alphaproteobacteria bacterium]